MKIALIWTGNQAPRVFSALQRGLAGAGGDSPTQTQQTQAEAKTQKHSTKPEAARERTRVRSQGPGSTRGKALLEIVRYAGIKATEFREPQVLCCLYVSIACVLSGGLRGKDRKDDADRWSKGAVKECSGRSYALRNP